MRFPLRFSAPAVDAEKRAKMPVDRYQPG